MQTSYASPRQDTSVRSSTRRPSTTRSRPGCRTSPRMRRSRARTAHPVPNRSALWSSCRLRRLLRDCRLRSVAVLDGTRCGPSRLGCHRCGHPCRFYPGHRGACERREHLAYVRQLRVDAVPAVGQRRQLAFGLEPGPLGLGAGVGDDVLGLSLRGLEQLPGPPFCLVAELLCLEPELIRLLTGLLQVPLGGLLPGREVSLGLLTPLGEARLELGGGLRGLRAGCLEDALGLVPLRCSLVGRLRAHLSRLFAGFLEELRRLLPGLLPAGAAVLLRLGADLGGVDLRGLALLLRLGQRLGLEVLCLFLSQPQDLLDARA